MLELIDICFERDNKKILDNINLKLDTDKFIVITGPNGSGKSTLAKIIMGIEKQDSGKILLNGKDISNWSVDKRAKNGISFAFQQPVKFKGITVYDLIKLSSGKAINKKEACEVLSNVGLCANEYVDREVNSSLSGGELKRIEIATVAVREANLTIFDEPEAGIDLWSFQNLIRVFEQIRNNTKGTTLIISHQERILNIADELILMKNGKVEKLNNKEELYKKDINQKAYNATQEFIDSGRGVLFGHDTVGNNFAHRCPTFRGFADQMGIRLIPDYDYSACRKVKVVNNGFLTSYPWKLSGTHEIQATHSTSLYEGGSLDSTVWLEFEKRGLTDEETGAKNTAYLCTNNSLALIQTGHSSGQATDDERKILANTLFYLKQLTNQTEAKDESFYDTEKPEKPEISGSYSTQGKSAWVQIGGKDKGTAYRYRVEAISTTNRDGQVRESNIVDAEAIS